MDNREGLKKVPNQGNEGSCTAFALSNIINGYKAPKRKEAGVEWEYLDGSEFFALVNSQYTADLQGALTPTMALEYAKKQKLIADYLPLRAEQITAEKLKKTLQSGFLILVVMRQVDRSATGKSHFITKRTGGGFMHTVAIVDYYEEKRAFVIVNSYGKERGDKGYCYLKEDEIGTYLSQVYAVIDSDDSGRFAELLYKKKLRTVIATLSEQRKYGNEKEKQAMNFANTMLRKVCFGDSHQWNMPKEELHRFIDRNF